MVEFGARAEKGCSKDTHKPKFQLIPRKYIISMTDSSIIHGTLRSSLFIYKTNFEFENKL
ncbi:hypothetical protein HZS_4379 [Henneguya salminicola]|nr:hypothetical protein HZS_4379 [Henneguya salminicola]